jgi:mannose-6-phosphate isomerase-like protein (cupin superfamily)
MKQVSLKDATMYQAAGHFNMVPMRLSGKDETGATKFWVGRSLFLPGGGAEWAYEKDSPTEKVYYVISGEITVKSKTETYHLKRGDAMFFGPNEGREMINEGRDVCETLVIINYP